MTGKHNQGIKSKPIPNRRNIRDNKKILILRYDSTIGIHRGGVANAKEYLACNTCANESEFIAYAKGHHTVGSGQYLVMNLVTGQLLNVYVERSYEPDLGLWINFAIPSPPVLQDYADLNLIKDLIEKKGVIHITAPINHTQQGFLAADTSQTWGVIMASPQLQRFLAAPNLLSFYRKSVTNPLIVVFVWPNLDVAKFKVINPAEPMVCCEYIEGSARNAQGQFIAGGPFSNGPGSNGGSTGGDYVQPSNDGSILVHVTPVSTLMCRSEETPQGVRVVCHWI